MGYDLDVNPIRIRFGAMAPPISKQICDQEPRNTIPVEELVRFDAWAKAITTLHLPGIMTDHQAFNARKRIMKRIDKALGAETRRGRGGAP